MGGVYETIIDSEDNIKHREYGALHVVAYLIDLPPMYCCVVDTVRCLDGKYLNIEQLLERHVPRQCQLVPKSSQCCNIEESNLKFGMAMKLESLNEHKINAWNVF